MWISNIAQDGELPQRPLVTCFALCKRRCLSLPPMPKPNESLLRPSISKYHALRDQRATAKVFAHSPYGSCPIFWYGQSVLVNRALHFTAYYIQTSTTHIPRSGTQSKKIPASIGVINTSYDFPRKPLPVRDRPSSALKRLYGLITPMAP